MCVCVRCVGVNILHQSVETMCTVMHVHVCVEVVRSIIYSPDGHFQSAAVDLIHFVSAFLFLLLLFGAPALPWQCPPHHTTSDTSTSSSSTSSLNTANRHRVCELGRGGGWDRGSANRPHFHKSRGRAAGRIVDSRCKSVCLWKERRESVCFSCV